MSCRIHRAATLRTNGLAWRDRVIADAESAEGRVVARNHRVSLDLIDEVAARIASYIARGEILVDWRDASAARFGPRTVAARGDLRRAATSSASAT
jgi:hypothetical protein